MKPQETLLYRFAQFTALSAFVLILIGSLVTTQGAGMAFPDWPLSSGSLNPPGWWDHILQRLEHGHRLFAEGTGMLVGMLCAWVWRNRFAIPVALGASVILCAAADFGGATRVLVAHTGLWSSALIFAGMILFNSKECEPGKSTARWLAFAAFAGVVLQALLGGLRVTVETGGNTNAAMAFRIAHGCFAQVELCLLVAVAATLSPAWNRAAEIPAMGRVCRLAWLTAGFVFLQLVLGAAVRHLGIALVIPTFPLASPHGLMPPAHNAYIDLNFTHTRFLALAVAVHIALLTLRVMRTPGAGPWLRQPAQLLAALLLTQIAFGISIIWTLRNPVSVTLHQLNGAALLATSLLLAMRASRMRMPGKAPDTVSDGAEAGEVVS